MKFGGKMSGGKGPKLGKTKGFSASVGKGMSGKKASMASPVKGK